MKTNIFSKLTVLLLMLMILITVSCKKKISKADLEYQVGQSVTEYYKENYSKNPLYKSFLERYRFETKVSLIKESENKYIGEANIELWENDEHGGDSPGTKSTEEKHSIVVIVDEDSFRWELQD